MMNISNPKVREILDQCKHSFLLKPKFDDLADYLPFICAFGDIEYSLNHILKLREIIQPEFLYQLNTDRKYRLSENYEIILGLIEIHRLLGDDDTLELAVAITKSCLKKFVWNNRIVSYYNQVTHTPSPLISYYNYSFVELLMDIYELTGDAEYNHKAGRIIYDAVSSPFFRKYHLFPMADYLIAREILFLLHEPKTFFIGKNSSIIFGMAKYAEINNDNDIKKYVFLILDMIWKNMVKDGIISRSYQPAKNITSSPNLSAAFMYLDMLNYAYIRFKNTELLDIAIILADNVLGTQSELGLFPYIIGDNRSWLDSETDISISLLELYELTGDPKYFQAAEKCYHGILNYNLATSSVNIHTGEAADPINFKAYRPTPKFQGLFLKLAFYFESGRKMYGPSGIASLVRDR